MLAVPLQNRWDWSKEQRAQLHEAELQPVDRLSVRLGIHAGLTPVPAQGRLQVDGRQGKPDFFIRTLAADHNQCLKEWRDTRSHYKELQSVEVKGSFCVDWAISYPKRSNVSRRRLAVLRIATGQTPP